MNKQQEIIQILNQNMVIGTEYPYKTIRTWAFDYKEGTLTSLLTKAKGAGYITHNVSDGSRTRVKTLSFQAIKEYENDHYINVSNNLGVTQVLCDKVKALKTVGFDQTEISKVLSVKHDTLKDMADCDYNVRKFNDLFRARLSSKTKSKVDNSLKMVFIIESIAKMNEVLDEMEKMLSDESN